MHNRENCGFGGLRVTGPRKWRENRIFENSKSRVTLGEVSVEF
jgi:hypothetical protein